MEQMINLREYCTRSLMDIFDKFYRKNGYKLLRIGVEKEDFIQDCFLKIHSCGGYEVDTRRAKLNSYVWEIARRLMSDRLSCYYRNLEKVQKDHYTTTEFVSQAISYRLDKDDGTQQGDRTELTPMVNVDQSFAAMEIFMSVSETDAFLAKYNLTTVEWIDLASTFDRSDIAVYLGLKERTVVGIEYAVRDLLRETLAIPCKNKSVYRNKRQVKEPWIGNKIRPISLS